MPERWVRELRRLGGLEPPNDLWERLQERRPSTDGPSLDGRRIGVALLALVLAVAAGLGLWRAFDTDPRPAIAPTPSQRGQAADIAVVVCGDVTETTTPVVQLQGDGLHLRIENRGGFDLGYLRDPEDIGKSWGANPDGETILPIPPGDLLAGCFHTPFSTLEHGVEEYARISVVDPEGFWPFPGTDEYCLQPMEAAPPTESGGVPGPLSGQVLFTHVTAESYETQLMIMNADGSEVRSLLDLPPGSSQATWSPDGTQIAFTGGGDIFLVDADGMNLRNITEDDEGFSDDEPAWSPDGSRIALRSNRQGLGIFVMDADGANMQPLASELRSQYPDWSPDGTRILFSGLSPDDPCGDMEVHVMNADGSRLLQLTDDGGFDLRGVWSPDGTKIAFAHSDARSDDKYDIYLMNADGTGVTRLTDWVGYDGDPVWSPDGTRIAFASDRDATEAQRRENEENQNPVAGISIYVMNADGSNISRLTGEEVGNAFPSDWRF